MKIPNDLACLIGKINESQDEWLTIFKAVHVAGNKIKSDCEASGTWPNKQSVLISMPALSTPKYITPKKFYDITTDNDDKFSKDYLVRIFSLFEPFIDGTMKLLEPKRKLSFWQKILKYFNRKQKRINTYERNKFLKNKKFIDANDEKVLNLAKETRNCYVHNANRISNSWIKTYRKIHNFYGSDFSMKQAIPNTIIPGGMPHFKKMGDLIIRITNDVETYVKNHV